ncbi:hypothetical protein E1B28_003247 [Marasmius oreades]|nr:uncharacterized protein E1B28_003247 [Marasmius oreades]KAG7085703.1 hypothetical protein E1B28_003247 [Marasmius oreades]
MSTIIPYWPFVALALAVILIFDLHRRSKACHYPPGPKPRLFVGNLFDIPAIKPWKVYRDWGKLYGDLIHFQVNGRHTIVVNSRELADRMFEKRSRIYSDRPFIPMMELTGWLKMATGLMRYGQDWRVHRRVYKQGFRAMVVPEYQPIVLSKVNQFLSNLRQTPELFRNHIRTYPAAVILATVYGYDIASSNDPLVDLSEEATGTVIEGVHPSTVVVNVLPFLRHLPLEPPIFAFQRIARRTRRLLNKMRTVPYDFVRNSMATGKGSPSFLAKLLEDHKANDRDEYQEELIRDAVTTAYGAGSETTASALATFFLAMALHPEKQRRAQLELDTVLGKDKLPTYVDRPDLPYVEAILRETLRWSPVLPLGVFRAAFLDDTIDGYFIPKGATVISNIW